MHAFLETVRGMATTRRHADLSAGISADIIAKYRKQLYGKKPSMQGLSDFALVYYGSPAEPGTADQKKKVTQEKIVL